MNRFVIPALLIASLCQSSVRRAAAEQPTKGAPVPITAPAAASAYDGPLVVLSKLKPGDAVRVKYDNEWVDGKVVDGGETQIMVQIGGNRQSFFAEKVWGTLEARDNQAAGGYLDPTTRANFELFKVAVDKLEAAQRSGDANALEDARDDAEQTLTRDYGKAGQHPRVGPTLARYWAIATKKCDELAATIVAEAEQAVATDDYNYFATGVDGKLSRAEQVLTDYKQFQTTPNAETARLEKVLADAQQRMEAAMAASAEAFLAKARVPKEVYTGADKKKLKAKVTAAWKKAHPDLPFIKLSISTNWVHTREWRTNVSNNGGYWYDWTVLAMDLVAKKDATTATVYPVGVSYQDGNKKNLIIGVDVHGFGNYRAFDMLLKNVK